MKTSLFLFLGLFLHSLVFGMPVNQEEAEGCPIFEETRTDTLDLKDGSHFDFMDCIFEDITETDLLGLDSLLDIDAYSPLELNELNDVIENSPPQVAQERVKIDNEQTNEGDVSFIPRAARSKRKGKNQTWGHESPFLSDKQLKPVRLNISPEEYNEILKNKRVG